MQTTEPINMFLHTWMSSMNDRIKLEKKLPPLLLEEMRALAEHLLHEDDDIVIVFDGRERAGKSTAVRMVARWFAYYFNTPFGIDNISFDTQEYMKGSRDFNVKTANKVKGYVNILDESRADLYKRRSMAKKLTAFTDYLTAVGKWRQIHFLVLPSFHDLDRYITRWRMKFLIHMYKRRVRAHDRGCGMKFIKGYYQLFTIGQLRKNMNNLVKNFTYPRQAHCEGDRPFPFLEVLSKDEMIMYERMKDEYISRIIDIGADEGDGEERQLETDLRNMDLSPFIRRV